MSRGFDRGKHIFSIFVRTKLHYCIVLHYAKHRSFGPPPDGGWGGIAVVCSSSSRGRIGEKRKEWCQALEPLHMLCSSVTRRVLERERGTVTELDRRRAPQHLESFVPDNGFLLPSFNIRRTTEVCGQAQCGGRACRRAWFGRDLPMSACSLMHTRDACRTSVSCTCECL